MNYTNGTVDTSTVAAGTKQMETPAIILILLFVSMFLFFFYMLVYNIYVDCKSYRRGPLTLTPVIPFPQDKLHVFKGQDNFKNLVPEAKIQYGGKAKKPFIRFNFWTSKYDYYAKLNQFMASTFKLHRLPVEYQEVPNENGARLFTIKPKISVPSRARTISIKMNGYEHGEKCHDFEPIGGAVPGSHFSYQMYGDNRIQVTRYVLLNGFSEIAGFCIYIEHPWISKEEYRWKLLHEMARSAATSTRPEKTRSVEITENSQITEERRNKTNHAKIEVVQEETTNLLSHESADREWTAKYCSKLRRIVLSSMDSGDVVIHQEWSDRNNQMRIEKCEECTKEGLEKEEQPPAYSSIFIA